MTFKREKTEELLKRLLDINLGKWVFHFGVYFKNPVAGGTN